MTQPLTRRQMEIYEYLYEHIDEFEYPPTLDELCADLGLSSKGSLHKQIHALIDAGLVEPMNNRRRGVRLVESAYEDESMLPLFGYIAAGKPIEAIEGNETIQVPDFMHNDKPCYVLKVKGDSMIEEGILDGDYIIIEQRNTARNGEIVVALIDGEDATLKRIKKNKNSITLLPANAKMKAMRYAPKRVQIQGVLVGQMRSYN